MKKRPRKSMQQHLVEWAIVLAAAAFIAVVMLSVDLPQ